MTTSIRMRSGFSDFDLMIASSPFSAVTTWYPCLDSVSMKNCRSVGDLGESIETVFGEDDLATGLPQENLRAAANGVRIVDPHLFHAGKIRGFAHSLYPRNVLGLLVRQLRRAFPSGRLTPPCTGFYTIQPNPVKTKPCAAYFRSAIRIAEWT